MTAARDHRQAIAIAVVGHAQVGFAGQYLRNQPLDIGFVSAVRRAIREVAVDIAVHGDDIAAQLFEQRRRDARRGAMARVDHDFKGHGDGDIAGDIVDVIADDIALGDATTALAEAAALRYVAQFVDTALGEVAPLEHDFQAIV